MGNFVGFFSFSVGFGYDFRSTINFYFYSSKSKSSFICSFYLYKKIGKKSAKLNFLLTVTEI